MRLLIVWRVNGDSIFFDSIIFPCMWSVDIGIGFDVPIICPPFLAFFLSNKYLNAEII